jgi:HAMP domain-containing protein
MLARYGNKARARGATRLALLIAGAAALAACSNAETTVVEPPAQPIKTAALSLQEGKPAAPCPPEVMAELRDKLTAKLYKPGAFGKGSTLKVTYRVLEYDGGDGSSFWSFGSLTGKAEGSLVVETIYSDKSGHEIGRIRSEGKVGSSLFGHSMDDAIELAANDIAEYTTKTFK